MIFFGRCFRTAGGWFDLECIYSGLLLGFRYGQYFSDGRSTVTSRKFIRDRRISTVIVNLHDLNMAMMSFLALSACFLDRVWAMAPSSL